MRIKSGPIAVDNYGNSYTLWTLEGVYNIDGEDFISHGSYDFALTSFDCNGVHRWTKIIGGTSSDQAFDLGTDTLGGVYVISSVNGARLVNYSIHIDTDTTIVSQMKSMFLVKYDTEGEFQWFRMPEDTVVIDPSNLQLGGGFAMDVAPNGDCYVYSKLPIGTYSYGAFEATFPGTVNDGENIYALKYDSNGNCNGGVHFDISYSGSLIFNSDIIRDHHTGWFYMSGRLTAGDDIFIFGGEQVTAENYVVQFDSSGFVNWTISANDIGIANTRFFGKPSVDELGNVYVTGGSQSGNSFGGFTFQNSFEDSGFPIFAKIDSMGNVVYATNASVSVPNYAAATAYSNNEVAVTGMYGRKIIWGDYSANNISMNNNVFLARFDATSNEILALDTLQSSASSVETPSQLTADRQGNFYVGGKFSGQLYVGDVTLYNQTGTSEGFIAKFGSDSCYCPLPEALFVYDSIPNEPGYDFVYTGSADVDSVLWDFGDGAFGYGMDLQHIFAESGTYTVCATAYNPCGADSVCITFEAEGPVGVQSINGFEEIRVYPNPAREFLTVNHASPGSRMEVINAVGQHLQSTFLNASPEQIDVSNLPAGIYLLQLTDRNGKRGYARFVKE